MLSLAVYIVDQLSTIVQIWYPPRLHLLFGNVNIPLKKTEYVLFKMFLFYVLEYLNIWNTSMLVSYLSPHFVKKWMPLPSRVWSNMVTPTNTP